MVLIGAESVRSQYVDAKADTLRWEKPFGRSFSVTSSAECRLLIELIQRQVGRTGRTIGTCSFNLAVGTAPEQSVPALSNNGDLIGTLYIHLDVEKLDTAVELTKVANAMAQAKLNARAGVTDPLAHIAPEPPAKTRVDPWELVRTRLGTILEFGDRIAEVHPWAKIAWGVVSAALRVISTQSDRDDRIDSLIEAMANSLEFVNEARPLHEYSQEHRVVITQILQQIIQCTYFVRDYSKDASFGVRAVQYMISGVDAQIDAYTTNLFSLVESLRTHSIVKGTVMVYRMLEVVDSLIETVQDIHALHLLNEMKYSSDAQRDLTHACLPGTRVESVEAIVRWAAGADRVPSESEPDVWGLHRDADDTSRVLWLCGVAGSGKSTILRSVAARLTEIGRLGTFYAFSQATQATTKPENLFSTIARNLADLDAVRKRRLIDVIKDDTVTRTTTSGRVQFERFIMDACSNVPAVGDTVVFIDAFDESGDVKARAELLFILTRRAAELPAGLRFVITSRFEPDVQRALETVPLGVKLVLMHDIPSPLTSRDISAYVQTELGVIEELENHALSIEKLAQMAATSFQWASTACRFIKDDAFVGYRPLDQLQMVLSSGQGLDQLYDTIMRQHCDTSHAKGLADLQLILGCVICAEIPIPLSTLDALLPASLDVPLAYQRRTLRHLGSLLSGTHRDDTPIVPLHTSYSDFLRDPERSGPFFVDVRKVHQILTRGCFGVMQAGLRFNICRFPSSYLSNVDINIEALVSAHVPFPLSYACKYWTSHSIHGDIDDELLDTMYTFLDKHFLHWLEVMSATQQSPRLALSLLSSEKFTRPDIVDILWETSKFCIMFGIPIAKSIPHIYLSGLAFAPTASGFYHVDHKIFRGLVRLQRSRQTGWPDIVHIMSGHQRRVTSVAFSPDGVYAASASLDGSVMLWDVQAGLSTGVPMKGHTDVVTSVSFSPDGRYIASGSRDGTVSIWNFATCLPAGQMLDKHSCGIISIAFSPDGRYIASGDDDCSVVLWDFSTGRMVPTPRFQWLTDRHYDKSASVVLFSSDGQCVVASFDAKVFVWNITTHAFESYPLLHAGWFPGILSGVAITWTQNHMFVARVLNQHTMVWHTKWHPTEKLHFERIQDRRTRWLRTLAFSSGLRSSHIVGCNSDHVYVWDHWRTNFKPRQLLGDTGGVESLVYSPDNRYILSGSSDSTVRLWDTEVGNYIYKDTQAHHPLLSTDGVQTAYTADEQHIALYHSDTLVLWDVTNPGSWRERHLGRIFDVLFAPGDQELVVIHSPSDDQTDFCVQVLDVRSFVEVWNHIVDGGLPTSCAFSPDGQQLAIGNGDGEIRFLDARNGEVVREPLKGHRSRIQLLAFLSDSQRLVSGHEDSILQIWDLTTNAPIFTSTTQKDAKNIAFSGDGRNIAFTCGDDTETVYVCDVGPDSQRSRWEIKHTYDPVQSITFSPDNRRVATSSGRVGTSDQSHVSVYDIQSRACILESSHENGDARVEKFTPNSKKVEIRQEGHVCLSLLLLDGPDPVRHPSQFALGPMEEEEDLYGGEAWLQWAADSPIYDPSTAHGTTHRNAGFPMKDGWMVGPEGELILWIPPTYRDHISKSTKQNIMDTQEIDLIFSDFKCGEDWAQCYTGSEPEA